MTNILQLNSSIHSNSAASSRLSDTLTATLSDSAKAVNITRRDLSQDPVPHLDAETFQAFQTAPELRSDRQDQLSDESQSLIDELKAADIVVIGLPMYNFGIPSTLKAWFDHVARAGLTFKYTDSGPVGLLKGKKAYVMATRGGRYAGTTADLQTGYVRNFLAFLGITDVDFVYAEGLALGAEARNESLAEARYQLHNLAMPDRLAA